MNNPAKPYHAVSALDYFGSPPSKDNLPREEEDFESEAQAEAWLRERRGGAIEYFDGERWWRRVEPVKPKEAIGS
jgi:hypothetical protein